MSRLMLIDAGHPEETRVAVVTGDVVEDFDFESSNKRQLRGNIYLAKVTRVEPSLQAAFVDYGGNRHGFLAFGEIHPDYYQIPVEDRAQLLRDVAAETPQSDADEDLDDEDLREEAARRAARLARKYPIQSVIRRRQIMLVQVVKEERGSKGAALTTYLSLAGRYCVLMPNTARGGGISRKIANPADRKRLKKIVQELEVPQGMGLIIRTAGAKRTKAEIKRDYDYLLRMFETIRERTLKSIAPSLIHEEGSLVHRSVRDLYDKDIDQILVQGEDAYKEAKEYVKMLMPSHARRVVQHKAVSPLFVDYGVERQLDTVFNPIVNLRSGGYIVINQTEALVAVDVNSGRATRERNIEATALKTNLEAAEEACRQMRLRDLAGLIVIDFIDMEDQKNVRAVERRMREALKNDRARVQIGKISGFGLLEISRQRRRSGTLESSSDICSHCGGLGRTRSLHSTALQALRMVETHLGAGESDTVRIETPIDVAMYLLNDKRDTLRAIEERASARIHVVTRPDLRPGEVRIVHGGRESDEDDDGRDDHYEEGERRPQARTETRAEGRGQRQDRYDRPSRGEREEAPRANASRLSPVRQTAIIEPEEVDDEVDTDEANSENGRDEDGNSRRRRRRGRRGGLKRRGEGDMLNVIDLGGDEDGEAGSQRESLQPRSQRSGDRDGRRSDTQEARDGKNRPSRGEQRARSEGRPDGRQEGRSERERGESERDRNRRGRRRGGRDRGAFFRPTDGGELLDGFGYDMARIAIEDSIRAAQRAEEMARNAQEMTPANQSGMADLGSADSDADAPVAEVNMPSGRTRGRRPRRDEAGRSEAAVEVELTPQDGSDNGNAVGDSASALASELPVKAARTRAPRRTAVVAETEHQNAAEGVVANVALPSVSAEEQAFVALPTVEAQSETPDVNVPIAGELRVEGGEPVARKKGWWSKK